MTGTLFHATEAAGESPMRIKALAQWYSASRTLAPIIAREVGPHAAWWEPFCGGLGVFMSKPRCPMETVNDLHGDLINLARVVQHPTLGPKLYRMLRRVVASEDAQQEAVAELRVRLCEPPEEPNGDTDLHRAAAYFVASWLGRGGESGTDTADPSFCVRYTKNGGAASTRFASAVDSIPAWRRRLRDVAVLRMDAFTLLGKIQDAKGVVIYCDPPYVDKGKQYVHDFTEHDHRHLAAKLRRFRHTRVIVSYYDHPLVRELYDGWTFVDCSKRRSLTNPSKGGPSEAPERLIINGPSLTEGEA